MPKKIIKIDSQILNAFSQCEELGNLTFIRNLSPIEDAFKIQRGSLCHDIILKYYTNYKQTRDKTNSTVEALKFGRKKVTTYPAIDMVRGVEILDTMAEYFDFWSGERWIPIEVEKIHKKVIYEDDEITVLYVAKIDLTVAGEENIPVMPVDHKTYERWFDPLSLDNQFMGYCEVLGVDFICVNRIGFQGSYTPDKKHRRVKLRISKTRREEWIHNTARIAKDIIFAIENNSFPKRMTQCGMYGGCRMKEICECDPRAREGIILAKYKVGEDWNPEKLSDLETV